ncbi:L-Ala-D/L-Glu epimerase [Thiorhodovibrio litoralis]|nr:o-succinylbenzoate synthase [Thiorhodovibrio winogradskyi]MBK5969921.1 o-succinylbenzoate synthase [Thiorhodovibrio winogradskyi]WPL12033.1 L-Ala-D/L-Glu epimerase [Thiorhodovibrio litoralis]
MRLQALPYRLPLRQPWHSARGTLSERCGWLLVAEHDGLTGYGDCAPLPAAGTEELDAADRRLTHWQARASACTPQAMLDALDAALPSATPAADAAVECALLDVLSKAAAVPLRAYLLRGCAPALAELATSASTPERIPVNGALGALMNCLPQTIAAQCAAGFRVLKLKVGTGHWSDEIEQLGALLAALPEGAQLRLDANGAWDFATASRILQALEALNAKCKRGPPPIESLEEPLRDPQDNQLAQLQARTSIALALDESLPRRAWPLKLDHLPVRRLVLKPQVLGGLRPSLKLAAAALEAGKETLVTSLIESAAGLWASAQLAAALAHLAEGSQAARIHHGLATADWLAKDLGEPPPIRDGMLHLGEGPGSGFQSWATAGDRE